MLKSTAKLDDRSISLRQDLVRLLASCRRGHVGSAASVMEILRVLYDEKLRYDSSNPAWPQRDRFLLSKGHGCYALYLFLAEKGFIPQDELLRVCTAEGILAGHPEHHIPGVEFSTGSLGHGLPVAVGLALSACLRQQSHHVYVLVGDGECNEGTVWEAALCANKHGLSNLTVLIDYNKMQCFSTTTEVLDLEPLTDKWRAFGFAVREVDGHDAGALSRVLAEVPFGVNQPSALICHTVKGRGFRSMENNPMWHHKNGLADADIEMLYKELETEA